MKVLHLCLSSFYIDNAGYQENHLIRQNVMDGHEVLVIASTEILDGKGGLRYSDPASYRGAEGAWVVRIPYAAWLPHKIARKLRNHTGVYDLIRNFEPNAILFHGCAGNEIATVARYAADHPDTLFYADSHEDENNSARNFISRNLLHRAFYRSRIRKALPHMRKVLCVNRESMNFVSEFYGVPQDMLEFFPLGGNILSDNEISERRQKTRSEFGLCENAFIFLQSGKITKRKKLADSLDAFAAIRGDHLRFWITGLLTEEVETDINCKIQNDPRVQFLGWKSIEQLNDILCAADVYVQPGTQSVTMQNALCCACPVIVDDVPGHRPYIPSGATLVRDRQTLQNAMSGAKDWDREEKRREALAFARSTLDYKKLATRILRA